MRNTIDLLNVKFDNITKEELLECYQKGLLCTPNVDVVVNNHKNKALYEAYKKAEFVVCDSRILKLSGAIIGKSFRDVIPGSSFFPEFYTYHKSNNEITIFLLGGLEGVAEKAKININNKVGRNIVVGTYSPPFGFEKDSNETKRIIDMVDHSKASVVMTGISDPKQTIWLAKNMDSFKYAKMFMALGATIDFEAGNIKRAPLIIQKMYLEWFFRFLNEPKRMFRRYFVNDMSFFWYLAKQKMGMYKNPHE